MLNVRILRSALPVFMMSLPALVVACGGGPNFESDLAPAEEPQISVERFLDAVSARDLEGMAQIFGTADGPFSETGGSVGCGFRGVGSAIGLGDRCVSREEVELRMDAIADILRHQSYEIVGERRVAGREDLTLRIGVNLNQGTRVVPDVPFLVVQSSDGEWYLQEIDLAKVTGG